ncbi:transposase, partial [Streptomyces viridochromogenes]|uniref:transposase n=1 Tax=Streptomyces viridochromogenes TaxID=1938 RepID=UPI001F38450F
MFDGLPPDLDRLRTLRIWHAMWLERIDHKITALQKRQGEQERGGRSRPLPPEWIVELGIGDGRPPTEVHAGECHTAGPRRRPVSRDEACRLLAAGLRACGHCQPDAQLLILDLAVPLLPGGPDARSAALRLTAGDDAATVTARQMRELTGRLIQAGQWKDGDPDILIVVDAGYDVPRLA